MEMDREHGAVELRWLEQEAAARAEAFRVEGKPPVAFQTAERAEKALPLCLLGGSLARVQAEKTNGKGRAAAVESAGSKVRGKIQKWGKESAAKAGS